MPSAKECVATFYGLFAAGDMAAVDAMIHPEFRAEEAAGLPYAGLYEGLAGWHRLIGAVTATYSEFSPQVDYLMTDDSGLRVAAMVRLTFRSAATGRSGETSLMEIWEVQDGLISAVRPYYWDTHAVRRLCTES